MCQYLVARKYGKVISKSPFEPSTDFNNNQGEMATIFIKRDYIGIEEKKAFNDWYKKADWYGYANENDAMRRLNIHGDFKEDVLPEEMCGTFGEIDINIEEAI